ncbi:MAG: carbamoyltransferase HypF [Pyrinomonadaceae bacterium]
MFDSAAKQIEENEVAERITVRGLVQGVGFRPTVWRLARDSNIRGSVINNGNGIEIDAQGSAHDLKNFVAAISENAPPLSQIFEIERKPATVDTGLTDFQIATSELSAVHTGVVPDAASCESCQTETLDPFARRFRYPFTNCTHCGPRLSIVENIPYDRANTTMRGFEICAECRTEYEDPSDRRFHAQPIACYKCGPKVWLERADGQPFTAEAFTMLDEVDAACTLMQRGLIVAIKGIGGFQLACDAINETTVARLRELKHRERKPFALMVRDLGVAREYCEVSGSEEAVLEHHTSPIVVVARRRDSRSKAERIKTLNGSAFQPETSDFGGDVAASVAPGVNTLGIMLPNAPLHLLLLRRMPRPIVLTSGNLSDEPQCIENDEARVRLGKIADYLLMHDRPIAQRVDDSVVKIMADEPRMLRRARGYAPAPIQLPKGFENAPSVLAFGGELKNTFCLLDGGKAIISQHIGDLDDASTQADYRHNLHLYETLYQYKPSALICDLHPEYLSSKLARERSEETAIPLIETQHHHAHIAACLAENSVPLDAKPVIGIALDGIGFGDDGTFWGGEFLLADYRSYERLAAFKPIAMIGGEQAIKEPWRNTYAHLMAEMGWPRFALNYSELELFGFLNEKPREILDGMMAKQLNSPLASSCGRLFDAIAAAVGIAREHAAYEGQGAVELEAIVNEKAFRDEDELLAYPFAIPRLKESNLPYIEPYAMWQALLGDMILKTPVPVIAARFHKGLAKIIVQMVEKLSKYETGEVGTKSVALSGGVWQNKVLLEEVIRRLHEKEFSVLTHRKVPTNDGGLSLGQATIAAAKLLSEPPAVAGG